MYACLLACYLSLKINDVQSGVGILLPPDGCSDMGRHIFQALELILLQIKTPGGSFQYITSNDKLRGKLL